MIKLERLDGRGTYSCPDEGEENKPAQDRYFISKRKMILFVMIAIALLIVSAVVGTFFSSSNHSEGATSQIVNPTVTGRSRKRVEKITEKPTKEEPWKNFRLPRTIIPVYYDILIRVNMSASIFHGLVNIRVSVKKDTEYIILHVDPMMKYRTMSVKDLGDKTLIKKKHARNYKDYLVVEVDKKLKRGRNYTISIQFYSRFNRYPTRGLYWIRNKSVYDRLTRTWATQKKMAVTFFAPVAARRNFPCFDEPDMKARFMLTLIYNRGYTSVSNMPLKTRRMTKDLVFDRFQTSPVMPTYMLNYAISDYTFTSTTSVNGTAIRVWSPKQTASQRSYALRVANLTLPFFESLFGIAYPIKKLDMITTPTFEVAAMENWGLINYISQGLLFDDEQNSSSDLVKKQSIALLIAHENAHQWLGNLVTLRWWNDIFVQEGIL